MSRAQIPAYIDLDQLEAALANRGGHNWFDLARCVGQPDVVFFPERNTKAAYQRARDICRACPALYPCLAEHLHEKWGCFGATTPNERNTLRDTLELRRADAA